MRVMEGQTVRFLATPGNPKVVPRRMFLRLDVSGKRYPERHSARDNRQAAVGLLADRRLPSTLTLPQSRSSPPNTPTSFSATLSRTAAEW